MPGFGKMETWAYSNCCGKGHDGDIVIMMNRGASRSLNVLKKGTVKPSEPGTCWVLKVGQNSEEFLFRKGASRRVPRECGVGVWSPDRL